MFSNPFTDPEWAERVTEFIAKWVEAVRAKTTQPLIYIARAIVFGIIAGVGAIVAIALLLIVLFRGVQALLEIPFSRDTAVWSTYLILGGIFMLIGFVLMKKRYTKVEK